jgi:DNA-binding Lrp family transcriptional regulator
MIMNMKKVDSKKTNRRLLKLLMYRGASKATVLARELGLTRSSVISRLSVMEKACIVIKTKTGLWRSTFHGEYAFIQLEQWLARQTKGKKKEKVVHEPILEGYKRWGSRRKGARNGKEEESDVRLCVRCETRDSGNLGRESHP